MTLTLISPLVSATFGGEKETHSADNNLLNPRPKTERNAKHSPRRHALRTTSEGALNASREIHLNVSTLRFASIHISFHKQASHN